MQAENNRNWLAADWDIALPLIAGTSITDSPLRDSGFNIARHVDDDPQRVMNQREKLRKITGLENDWLWLNQTHSAAVVNDEEYACGVSADAVISRNPGKTAVVMTADCVPVLLCSETGDEVAAIHAGWPGLYQRIIRATLKKMHTPNERLFAWIGPCAGKSRYEVDEAFYQRFVALDGALARCFTANRPGHYLADLVSIAKQELQQNGVEKYRISGGQWCSISDPRFFSHRRDGALAGRMASFICPL